ncbi:MAG: Gfo/Idh/MocA family oxidoreductase [Gemmatimonadaceae bacterium]|nr:Gfo/Idh/MocA family oxidoreductase [Gemmatimonadaceae bacterium]
MSLDPVGVAVIGAGILGSRHARVYHERTDARLVAVVDPDATRAANVASGKGARAFSTTREMLAAVGPNGSGEVRAASVATPDHLHLEPVTACLEAGVDVFVEKPLAIDEAEGRAMVALARERSRVLIVNYSQRWLAEHRRVEALVRDGALGTPAFVQSHRWDASWVPERMIPWSAETTPIHFMSSHDIDLILHWLGDRVVSVTAVAHRGALGEQRALEGRVDGYAALLTTARGTVIALHSSWILPDTFPLAADSYLEVLGGRGSLWLGGSTRELKLYTQEHSERVTFAGPATATEVNGMLQGAFTESLAAFLDAVRARVLDTPTSAARTLHVVEVQSAILRSAQRGVTVQLAGGDA